jgi:hypothetical protein
MITAKGGSNVPCVARWAVNRFGTIPLLACLIGFIAFAAMSDDSVAAIPWDASTPLTWDLFRAAAPADAIHRSEAAAIHMTIRWHASYSVASSGSSWTGHVQRVTVANTMEPSLSWAVPGKVDDRVLRHEQAHFDLNEVYRRMLEALLPCLQAQNATKEGVIGALDATLHQRAAEILGRLQAAQTRYDAETCHGNDATGQARWEDQIAVWMRNPTAAP